MKTIFFDAPCDKNNVYSIKINDAPNIYLNVLHNAHCFLRYINSSVINNIIFSYSILLHYYPKQQLVMNGKTTDYGLEI